MKKFVSLLLCAALALSCLAGCGTKTNDTTTSKSEESAKAEAPATSDYSVAMVTDYGDITDQSFNQTTYEACQAFTTANNIKFSYYKPSGDSTAERVASVEKAISDGYNVIVMPGYAFAGTIVEVSELYKDVKFIALDVAKGDILAEAIPKKGETYDNNPDAWDINKYCYMDNVYCAVYQEELSGYMAGYAAVKLGYKKLGFLGGTAVPAVIRFGYGFVQGADAAAVELGTDIEINYAYGNQFYGDADITAAMDTWYGAGTEVVFACGGGIYNSAAEAAVKVNGKVIGVDVDQAPIINEKYGDNLTVTSAMKGLYPTTFDTLTDVLINGNWSNYAGKITTLGLISGEDPTINYVQIPMETTQWSDTFTKDNYKSLVADMFSGKIKVSSDTSALPTTTKATVNNQGNIK